LEGVPQSDWANNFGVSAINGNTGVSMQLVTGSNVGNRLYILDGDNYYLFKLKNREFSVDVDVSTLPCGLNGALYFVEMEADGGAKYPNNKAGAKYGTGYCDAQCPKDSKWV
jgi:cellulose 1,4-beta-cellobiosidase